MNKILSFCINLLLLVISDAVPLKLIAGDRSVVKKDGATHTIFKYYVVPNDYDENNVTNTAAATQKATLRMHRLYSKSMHSGSIDEEISENKTTTVNDQSDSDFNVDTINGQVNIRSDLNVGQGEVSQQPNDNTESTVSLSTEQTLDADDLGNLQVEPIINPIKISRLATDNEIDINVNSAVTVQNRSALIVVNVTDYQTERTFEKDSEDELDDLILSKLGIAVHESYSQNIESFWKLVKLNIDKKIDDDELLAKVKRLILLLNIFTNLYEAAQLQKPVETMIDGIIKILQIPYIEKSNGDESQAETNISGNYNEECLRKCGGRSSIPQLDSNGTYLSETEGQQASDSLKLENLPRRLRVDSDDDDLIKMFNDPDLNHVTVSNEPTNVLRSLLPDLYNLNVGVPDGYNVLSAMPTPTLNDIARNNHIQEDPNLIKNIPDSAKTVENLDDLPVTVESRFTDLLPFTLESRTTNDLPWTNEDKTTEYLPWSIQTTLNDGLPWHIEDKKNGHHPFTIEHRTTKKLPWNIESRSDPTWTIENKMGHSPITTLYQSSDSSATTYGGNILLNPNQSIKSRVHSVKNGIKKPYHIYTYVINPTTNLYEVPNAGNVGQMVSRQPHENLGTTLNGLPTLHGGNKVVYKNQPSQSHYVSQYSLSNPTIDVSRQLNLSQVTHTNYVTKTYNPSHEVNPSNLHFQTPQEDIEPQYLVEHGSEPNQRPALLQSNTNPSESQSNSSEENEARAVPEIVSPPGVLLMNVPSNPFESLLSLGNTEPVFTASASSSIGDSSNVNPDIDDQYTKPNSYNPNDNLNRIQQSSHPGMVNKASPHAHASVQTSQYPGLISSSASSLAYTNGPDEPVYGGQILQQLGAISTASAHSTYTNIQNDNDVPTPVYGGDTNNYPGLISKATTQSEYTNVPNDYGHDTNTQPDQISKVYQYPVYPNVVHNYDDLISVNGIQIQKYPGYISKAPSHSEYTIPVNHNDPTRDYEDDTDIYSGKIQNVPDYSEYTNEVNHNIKIKPVNGGPTQNVDNFLVPYQPYGHKVHAKHQPSLIVTTPDNQNLKLKLAPTYRLFTVQNLKNLENAVIKTIQMHGSGIYDDRALINLKKIINVILILAENLEETDGTNAWYEKIFYNSPHSQHPLQHYVYNLIRQRWLHDLMLVLYKNNFSINILQHPGIFSFLESWQYPEYVQNFMEAEDLMHIPNPQKYDDNISNNQNDLQNKFSTYTSDDLLEKVPKDLEKYVTKNVIDSYKSHNEGIVLSIAGIEAEPDANAIIDILQNFLHYKNYIETQENVIIRDNKVEMLRQIILFLKEKGYGPNTIADLIRKLYTAIYSTEGKGCQTHHTNLAKNMYDVILPVLRRSGG